MGADTWVSIGSAFTWTNVDWSSMKSSDIHTRAISQEMPQPSITKICLKITCLKFQKNSQDQWVKQFTDMAVCKIFYAEQVVILVLTIPELQKQTFFVKIGQKRSFLHLC